MQANYPDKLSQIYWDPVRLNYPVRKFPETGYSSETLGRQWRAPPEVLKSISTPLIEEKEYCRDYNVTSGLTRSQTALDFDYKIPEVSRFNKHTSCNDNIYIFPPARNLSDRTPAHTAHGTTEMKSSYTEQLLPFRQVTEKNQFKHPATLPLELPEVKQIQKEIEPLDTTYDGHEKYLDPYLTTSRLVHRPFTAEQLEKSSNKRNVLTYYTYSDIPWVRSPKPNIDEWRLPLSKSKSVYDREKFKDGFREIRTHNMLNWVPRTFRTETRDNYIHQKSRPESQIHNNEEEIRSFYQGSVANLQTNIQQHDSSVRHFYNTENSTVGSRKPGCAFINQFVEENKRLVSKSKLSKQIYL